MSATDTARGAFAQWRDRASADWLADDPHLLELLGRHGASTEGLAGFARDCAGPIDALARENNRDEHLPRLRRWDGQGNRIEAIDHHPTYTEIGRLAYRAGIMSRYAERRHAAPVKDALRKMKHTMTGVIVVGQFAGNHAQAAGLTPRVGLRVVGHSNARVAEDPFRNICAGIASFRAYL